MNDETLDFREALQASPIDAYADFGYKVQRAYEVIDEVRRSSEGHGLTLILMEDDRVPAELRTAIKNSKSYNGDTHGLYDDDIAQDLARKRDRDCGTLVDETGLFKYSHIFLEAPVSRYELEHGIGDVPLWKVMGYDNDEDPAGARGTSHLVASGTWLKNAVLLCLGESHVDEETGDVKTGTIKVYYRGDRIHHSGGRKMRWDLIEKQDEEYIPAVAIRDHDPRYETSQGRADQPNNLDHPQA